MDADLDYKLIFESSPVNLLVLKPDLSIVAVTDGYLKATQRKRSELISKNIFDAFPDNPNDDKASGVQNLSVSLQRVLEQKSPNAMPVQKYDIPVQSSNGGEFESRFWSPLNVPVISNNEVVYIIHRVDDVTKLVEERKRLEEFESEFNDLQASNRTMALSILENSRQIESRNAQLQQINEELNAKSSELTRSNGELANFASTAAHDIQAPFRVVGNYLSRIEEELETKGMKGDLDNYFQRIYHARERIATLIDDLLAFAMVSKDEFLSEKVNVDRAITEALENLEALIKQKDAIIEVKRPMLNVNGIYTQIVQVFQNLIGNGITYNKNRPHIFVESYKEGEELTFVIKDNGLGIEKEYHDRIFEVFQRLNARSEFPGTGLGLSITKRVIERHNGRIWIESEPGKGSIFYFTLPANSNG